LRVVHRHTAGLHLGLVFWDET